MSRAGGRKEREREVEQAGITGEREKERVRETERGREGTSVECFISRSHVVSVPLPLALA